MKLLSCNSSRVPVGWFLPPLSPRPPFRRCGSVLPRHTPQPPLLPSGEEGGSEQPHLISSLRLGHHRDTFLPLYQWRLVIPVGWFVPPLSPPPPFLRCGSVLPRHTPQPPLLPSGEERGSEQPHLSSSQRPRHHRRLLCCMRRRGCHASRRLAGATQSNVDLAPLSRPVGRERGWGRGWGNSSACVERSTSGINVFSRQGYHSHVKSNYGNKKHA